MINQTLITESQSNGVQMTYVFVFSHASLLELS